MYIPTVPCFTEYDLGQAKVIHQRMRNLSDGSSVIEIVACGFSMMVVWAPEVTIEVVEARIPKN